MDKKENEVRDNILNKLSKELSELADIIHNGIRSEKVDYEEIFYYVEKTTNRIDDQMDFFYQYIMDHDFDILLKQAKEGKISFKTLSEKAYVYDFDDYMDVYESPVGNRFNTIKTMINSVNLLSRILREFKKLGIKDENKEILKRMYELTCEASFNIGYLNFDYQDLLKMLGIEEKQIMEIRQEI